jgi:hypothetical protein
MGGKSAYVYNLWSILSGLFSTNKKVDRFQAPGQRRWESQLDRRAGPICLRRCERGWASGNLLST